MTIPGLREKDKIMKENIKNLTTKTKTSYNFNRLKYKLKTSNIKIRNLEHMTKA